MSKILTVYFSAGGATAKLAQTLAKEVGADIFEIKPETPYTPADIKWTNPLARCNKEKIGKKDVPIAGKVGNIAEYDTILLGFPIWYYGAPNIVQTFLKSYDLSGKKIILFATSGGSNFGKTAEKLSKIVKGEPKIIESKVISSTAAPDELISEVKKYL